MIVEDLYKLESSLQPEDGKYKLRVVEFEQEHSYLYDFELLKIVHPTLLTVGIVNNKIVYYKDVLKPATITDSKGKDLKGMINGNDSFQGKAGEILKLKFNDISNVNNLLIWKASLRGGYARISENLKDNLKPIDKPKEIGVFLTKSLLAASIALAATAKKVWAAKATSIHFYLLSNGKSTEIGVTHPRENSSMGLLDISSYLPKKQSPTEIHLKWTETHDINSISLAQMIKPNDKELKVESLQIESLRHSKNEKIDVKDLKKGAEIIPGQYLELSFPYKDMILDSDQTVSFVFRSKGFYRKMTVIEK